MGVALSSNSLNDIIAWTASCPAPIEFAFLLLLLQVLSIFLLTSTSPPSSPSASPSSPLSSVNPNSIMANASSPSSLATPTRLSPSLYASSKAGGGGSRPFVQKNDFRGSVLKPLGDGSTAQALLNLPQLDGYLKKKGQGVVGWQKRFFTVELGEPPREATCALRLR
jgi:hypothetical protein